MKPAIRALLELHLKTLHAPRVSASVEPSNTPHTSINTPHTPINTPHTPINTPHTPTEPTDSQPYQATSRGKLDKLSTIKFAEMEVGEIGWCWGDEVCNNFPPHSWVKFKKESSATALTLKMNGHEESTRFIVGDEDTVYVAERKSDGK